LLSQHRQGQVSTSARWPGCTRVRARSFRTTRVLCSIRPFKRGEEERGFKAASHGVLGSSSVRVTFYPRPPRPASPGGGGSSRNHRACRRPEGCGRHARMLELGGCARAGGTPSARFDGHGGVLLIGSVRAAVADRQLRPVPGSQLGGRLVRGARSISNAVKNRVSERTAAAAIDTSVFARGTFGWKKSTGPSLPPPRVPRLGCPGISSKSSWSNPRRAFHLDLIYDV